MNPDHADRALFVTPGGTLQPGGGGVQWCTREYFATLTTAGFTPQEFPFGPDRSLRARLMRRLRPRPHDNYLSPELAGRIVMAAHQADARWIFLNNTAAGALAPALRRANPALRLVFLSHGAEITDVVNNLRLGSVAMPAHQARASWLGHLLVAEIAQRAALDATITISQPDTEVERWLGAKATLFLPRQVVSRPLPLAPVPGRVGCVATLDHGPNRHGLEELASVLDQTGGVVLRLVGGPETIGRALATRFRSIHYCGRLDDETLAAEAATWRAFVNPIFCPARGASTKVATALGWGLPVLTTPDGARGYVWSQTILPHAETPAQLAALAHKLAVADRAEEWTHAAREIVRLAPEPAASAVRLRRFLDSLFV